jgi:hypothetical protein
MMYDTSHPAQLAIPRHASTECHTYKTEAVKTRRVVQTIKFFLDRITTLTGVTNTFNKHTTRTPKHHTTRTPKHKAQKHTF